jgi:ubiquinone/menaquinone biosynthesis C-methylase UbiE
MPEEYERAPARRLGPVLALDRRAKIRGMAGRIDPEGLERLALAQLAPMDGLRVLEIGCGDGRLTFQVAPAAASVLAVDPDAQRIEEARRSVSAELAEKVTFVAQAATEVDVPRHSFDLALFSWSL